MELNDDQYYQILHARDVRFDGQFFVGVASTGIYCRPICPAQVPRRDRCTFYRNAAAAEGAGYRPCLRCRPELAPGLAPVDGTKRLARAIVDRLHCGALSEGTLEDLADEFSLSSRQLRRIVLSEFGVTPVAIARTRRLLLAKQLLTDSSLRLVDIAFASGFSSVRQFNRAFLQAYRMAPSTMRRSRTDTPAEGIPLKLGFRPPLAWNALTGFLVSRSDGLSQGMVAGHYVRTVRLGKAEGWIAARPVAEGVLLVQVAPSLLSCLPELQQRLRRLFDLDTHPGQIEHHLVQDEALAVFIRQCPGLRLPGTIDGFELALRAILGQQISVKAASTLFKRVVERFGTAVETPFEGIDRLAPSAADIAQLQVQQLLDCGITRRRAETIRLLAQAVADQCLVLEPSADPASTREQLLALPGIGPWTVEYVAMRALADPDAFPPSDLGLLKGMNASTPAELNTHADHWRPWRAYAAFHIWHSLGQGG